MLPYETTQHSDVISTENECPKELSVRKYQILRRCLTHTVKAVGWLMLACILGAGSLVVYLLSIFQLL